MTWRLAAAMLFLILPARVVSVEAGTLRGGAAAIDITPLRLPVSMTGGFQDRLAMKAHDRLHARCVVLDDERTRIAIVICDSCLITRDIYDAAKTQASKATGIPVNRMLTAATHTHTAPTAVPLAQCSPDPQYVEQLKRQIAQAIVAADSRLKPVEIGWGVAEVPEEISNRRWFVKPEALKPNPFGGVDDKVRMNPPRGVGALIRPAGPTDPAVTFLSMRSTDGRPISLLANYGLHYVGGIPPGQLSADYFGEFARRISDRLNADTDAFVGIMSNGASGDVNNYRFPDARPRSAPFERVQAVASTVADRVTALHEGISFFSDGSIRMKEQELELGIRRPDAAEIVRAKSMLANAADPDRLTMNEVYAQESIRFAEEWPSTLPIKLQAISIGELAIVAVPCEVFAEVGLEIKRRSPFSVTCVIALANGYNGYLPSPKQHALGGYETWRSAWSYLETEASTKITDSLLSQLQALKKEQAAGSTRSKGDE